MNGPAVILKNGSFGALKQSAVLYEWRQGDAYLFLDEVAVRGIRGAILCYNNPPVHQIGNPALDAYLQAVDALSGKQVKFLIMYFANDPVHAGGDLKESLKKLDSTIDAKKELILKGASASEIDKLYGWGDERLQKAFALYKKLRALGKSVRLISVAGGGTRFGGSAEMALAGDIIVGDSRSAMCFSESMIGLIPGWGGIGRAVSKAGMLNAKYLAMTAKECKAQELLKIGIYNAVVDVPFALPRMQKTDNPQADKEKYIADLQKNNDETGMLLLAKAFELALCPENEIPRMKDADRPALMPEDKLHEEVNRRKNPLNYEGVCGKLLQEVKAELAQSGRPLAPQSIDALEKLFASCDMGRFNEEEFIRLEMELDALLYRDERFRAGIIAALEQKVADFRS
ncbi:MAG: enoyl-CoA hydratase/isomerase family protein [Planctomycetes bacterium]|nr:enoyl-CoA hydratase/isomerase family protein [Planctomycetota bacterium]